MKNYVILFGLVLFTSICWSQKNPITIKIEEAKRNGVHFQKLSGVVNTSSTAKASINSKNIKKVSEVRFFTYNAILFPKDSRSRHISLSFPSYDMGILEVELIEKDGINEQIISQTSRTKIERSNTQLAKHYRGGVKGYDGSLVALSVFDDEIRGIISIKGIGDYNIIKEKGSRYHAIIKESNIKNAGFVCETAEKDIIQTTDDAELVHKSTANSDCSIKIYFEVVNRIFKAFDEDIIATENYVLSLFNQVAAVYEMEDINLKLSGIFIWTTDDPYRIANIQENLMTFKTNRPNFDGDLAHLIGAGPVGGRGTSGLAFLGGLCSDSAFGVTSLPTEFRELPNNLTQVKVVAHELGHNLGSHHTHACVWNGNRTTIDDYGNYISYALNMPFPGSDGINCLDISNKKLDITPTIMSYYDTFGHGTFPLSNGFGEQPAQRMRDAINNAECILDCSDCSVTNIVENDLFDGSEDREQQSAAINLIATNTIHIGAFGNYSAGEEVVLKNGFVATDGSFFLGHIEPCSSDTDNLITANDASAIVDETIIASNKSFQFRVYPNPTEGKISIDFLDNISGKLQISSITGQLIFEKYIQEEKDINFSINAFPKGIYILEVITENKTMYKKIIKE